MIRSIVNSAVTASLWLAAPVFAADAQRQGDDRVLRDLATGMAKLQAGDLAASELHLVRATDLIAGIWGGGEEARRARQLWYAESVKSFRGEPYERMMAFFYRGLLHFANADFGNAQASFRQSVLQDAFAEEDQARGDAAAPLLMLWLALRAQGSEGAAREAESQLAAFRPDLAANLPESVNVVLVVETGTAPRKVPDGLNAERLRYFRGRGFTERIARVSVGDGPPTMLWPTEDVFFQARTRGGRPVDAMLRGRAVFAASASAAGGAFSELGSALATQGSYAGAMGGDANAASRIGGVSGEHLEIAGAAVAVLAAFVQPAADTRYWDNLPDAVHVLPMQLAPGRHRLSITFADADGNGLDELTRSIDVDVPSAGSAPTLLLVRSRDRSTRHPISER